MSGQAGARGYLVQTLICVLDSLEDPKWQSLIIEPNLTSDKVDVIWYYPDRTKVVQIKHSQNQINWAMVKAWAEELEQSIQVEEYELKLIGPCNKDVASRDSCGKVSIPKPHELNFTALIEQAAHKLAKYLESKSILNFTSTQRELVIEALVTKLSVYSTKGSQVSREDFDKLLIDWTKTIYLGISENDKREPIERCVTAYRQKWTSGLCNLQIFKMSSPLNLKEIYVKLRVRQEEKLPPAKEEERVSLAGGEPTELLRLFQGRLAQQAATAMSPEEALSRFKKITVLGEPGAGKTTILLHLAVEMASGALPNLPDFPVYVELRSFVESGMKDLLAFVVSNCAKPYNFPHRSYLQKKLNEGEAALLLDGLDEVLGGKSPEEAKQVYSRLTKIVRGLATQFSNAPIVVACRRAGWQGGLTGFHTLEVLDFDESQIQEFVNNWFKSDQSKAKGLLQELEKNLRMKTLAANPLILLLMAIVYGRELKLPERRSKLYQHCVEVLLEEWDSEPNRGFERLHHFTPTQMQNLLIEVAWYYHHQGKGYFREAELLRQLPSFLSNSDINIPLQENKAILKEITGSSSLLKEAAYKLYGFLHLTFQEYFAALAAKKKGSIGWQEVVAHRHEPWWEEVILLLAECMDDATPLLLGILGHPLGQLLPGDINQLVPEGNPLAANDDLFHSDLLLAARCLVGKPTIQMQGLRDRIIAEVKNLFVTSPYNFDWDRAARVLVEISDQVLTEQLLGMLTDNSKPPEQRASIASAFREFGDRSVAQRLLTLLERATRLDQSVRMGIVDTLATLKVNDAAFCLLDMLKAEEDVTNQARIAEALVLIDNKSESVVGALMEMLDTEMRMDGKSVSSGVKDIVWTVGRLGMGNNDVARSLLDMLLDETRGLGRKTSFAQALKNLRDASLTQEILERIQDKTIKWQLRWLLTETLEGLEECAKSSLMEMLKSQDIDERVRVGIAATLGVYGEQVVIPQLRKAIEDQVVPPDWEFSSGHTTWMETGYVWHRIARVLKSLDDDSVVPTLAKALDQIPALPWWSEEIHTIIYTASEYKSEAIARQILTRVREQAWNSPLNQLRLLAALPAHATESLIPDLLKLLAERRMYFVPGWKLEDKVLAVIAQLADDTKTVKALWTIWSETSSNDEEQNLANAIYCPLYSVSRRARVRVNRDGQIEPLVAAS